MKAFVNGVNRQVCIRFVKLLHRIRDAHHDELACRGRSVQSQVGLNLFPQNGSAAGSQSCVRSTLRWHYKKLIAYSDFKLSDCVRVFLRVVGAFSDTLDFGAGFWGVGPERSQARANADTGRGDRLLTLLAAPISSHLAD